MDRDLTNFKQSLAHWGTPDFSNTLKQQLMVLTGTTLPLQQGLRHSSYASDDVSDVVVMGFESNDQNVQAKAGIFYRGMDVGSCCADDPTPVEYQTEYCVVLITIDRNNGDAQFSLTE